MKKKEGRKMGEARILTADEIRQLPRASIVWIDYWDGEDNQLGTMFAAMMTGDGMLVDEEGSFYNDFEANMTPDRFDGSMWRFWSAEPTQEQRERTAWPNEQRKTD